MSKYSGLLWHVLASILTSLIIALAIFADSSLIPTDNKVGSILAELGNLFLKSKTQWLTYGCFCFYLIILSLVKHHFTRWRFWLLCGPSFWIINLVLSCTIAYDRDYHYSANPPQQALVLVVALVLGCAAGVWLLKCGSHEGNTDCIILIIGPLVALLCLSSLQFITSKSLFSYHDQARWSGAWASPNIYGLLMGVGIALSAGIAASGLIGRVSNQTGTSGWKSKLIEYPIFILLFVATIFMAHGLIQSYSRGAWAAAVCGLIYLTSLVFRNRLPSPVGRNWPSLLLILLSLVTLASWHFRQSEWYPARRLFSIANQNDFSWRNRVITWEGTLQMMSDKPWFGIGWSHVEPIYDGFYRPAKMEQTMAIQMNDYFMLGTSVGIPGLACFIAYVWLSLQGHSTIQASAVNRKSIIFRFIYFIPRRFPLWRQSHAKSNLITVFDRSLNEEIWLRSACRSAGIIFLVGFFFDGGLFKLASGSIFCILLELGREKIEPTSKCSEVRLNTAC